jgi:sec-independent protein translocase protein TatC
MPEQAENGKPSNEFGEMGLLDHLDELRKRLLRCLASAFLGMLACYVFAKQLFDWLMLPLFRALPEKGSMIYTAPHEAFFTYIKVAFVAGIFLTSPYIFYQIWLFVRPGLYASERKLLIPIAFCSALLFVTGAVFGYFIIFPYAYKFFMGFSDIFISPMITMREGFSFAVRLLLAFGIVFELPLVIFFLARLGLVTSKTLRKKRKYAILIAFMLSAMLTPPDIFTQTFMAGPLVVLYEVGVIIAAVFGKKPKPRDSSSESAKEASEEA